MTPALQFSLTFVTLVVLTLVLYLRLLRYETYMEAEKEGMKNLNDRLQKLVDGLEALGTRRVEGQLSDIHELLADIRDGLESRSQQVVMQAQTSSPEVARSRPSQSLVDVVEAKLYNLGYSRVSVVTDLSKVDAHGPVRVVVEAERDGALHKGHLVLNGSAVTEFEMQQSYTTFP
ncbi:MAG TPA: hypothetical protein PKE00_02645 [Planctomycetota bacterium]|nr:hypothetical protein [Planctomycetota bacterium]